MSDIKESSEQEEKKSTSAPITIDEIIELEKAAEEGNLEAQKRLCEIDGVKDFEEYIKNNTISHEDMMKQLLRGKTIEEWRRSYGIEKFNGIPNEKYWGTVYKGTEEKLGAIKDWGAAINIAFNGKGGEEIKNILNGLEKHGVNLAEIASLNNKRPERRNFILTNLPPPEIYGPPEDRLANEMAENNRVNREILKELKRQNELLDLNHSTSESMNTRTTKKDNRRRGKSGRPHLPDDVWAWEQINKYNRKMNEVEKEWLEKIKANPKRCNMIDPKRQFNRIIKPKWGNKSRQNI